MATAENMVKTTLTLDASQYQREAKSASKHTDAIDDSLKRTEKSSAAVKAGWAVMGAAVTLAGAKIAGSLMDCVDAASDLQESASKMKVIFGNASAEIVKFADDSAQKLGMTKQAAYDAASQMATFGKAAGLTGDDLSKFSTDMVTLSSDLASFFNTDPGDAMEAIGAALRGESEPIRRYGVLLDDATLKARAMKEGIIDVTTKALTPQQKALAAQKEILAQTADAQGDFARTSDGLANSRRKFSAEMGNLKAELGEALLPTLSEATKGAGKLAHAFGELPDPVKRGVAIVSAGLAAFAMGAPAVSGAIKGIGAVRDAIKGMQSTAVGGKIAAAVSPIANIGKGLAGAGFSASMLLGPAGLAAAAIGGIAYAGKALADAQIDKRIDAIRTAMMDARAGGEHLDSVLSLTITKLTTAKSKASAMQGTFSNMGGQQFASPSVGMDPSAVQVTVTGLKAIVDATKDAGFAAQEAKGQMAAMDSQLAGMDPQAAAVEVAYLRDTIKAQGGSVEDLNALLPQYTDKVRQAAAANGDAASSQKDLTMTAKELAEGMEAAKTAISNYITATLAAEGSADALIGAEDRLAQAVDKNAKAHARSKGAVEGRSQAARNNRAALRDEAQAILTNAQAMADKAEKDGKTGKAAAIMRDAIEKGRDSLIKQAKAAGMTGDQVDAYVKKLLKMPPKTNTEIKADITDGEAKIKRMKARLKDKDLTDPERSKLRADISDLEAKVTKSKRKLGDVAATKTTPKITADKSGFDVTVGKAELRLGKLERSRTSPKITPEVVGMNDAENKIKSLAQREFGAKIKVSFTGGADGFNGSVGPSHTGYARPVKSGHANPNWARYKSGKWHGGTDIGAASGTPVHASSNQRVRAVNHWNRSYGYHILATDGVHDFLYAHLSSTLGTHDNQFIGKNQVIGRVGSTGHSTGPHLHYEVRPAGRGNGAAINPLAYMADGGKINGPGSGTSDSVPVMGSNGEWIINAAVSRRMGDRWMAALNAGQLDFFAKGGKVKKGKKTSSKGPSVDDIVADIEWQRDMGQIGLEQQLAVLRQQLARLAPKPGKAPGQAWKELALKIHQLEAELSAPATSGSTDTSTGSSGPSAYQTAMAAFEHAVAMGAQGFTTASEQLAQLNNVTAETTEDQWALAEKKHALEMQIIAEQQQAAAEAAATLKAEQDRRDSFASSVGSSMVGQMALGQTRADGKKWGAGSMLADFAKRAGQASEFASMVQQLTARGLSEDVVNQVVSAGPQAGADMARALLSMTTDQLATVNAQQNTIRSAAAGMGGFLANAFYGVAGDGGTMKIELGGGSPVVLQLDSRTIYEGQLQLQRQMGGSYALVPR